MVHATADLFGSPSPGDWGDGPKGQISLNLIYITKSVSKIFKPNVVCFLTKERYKLY